MEHSESIATIALALAKAQGAIEGAKKDSTNPHFKMQYADLSSIWDACRKQLSDNEIAVIQAPGAAENSAVQMTTMLCHSSGEWFRTELSIPMSKVDAQGYGSAVTYARRYALAAMVGVAPEEDDGTAAAAIGGDNRNGGGRGNGRGNGGGRGNGRDDGRSSSNGSANGHADDGQRGGDPGPAASGGGEERKTAVDKTALISDDQRDILAGLAPAAGMTLQSICDGYKIDNLKDLPAYKFDKLRKAIGDKILEKENAK